MSIRSRLGRLEAAARAAGGRARVERERGRAAALFLLGRPALLGSALDLAETRRKRAGSGAARADIWQEFAATEPGRMLAEACVGFKFPGA